MLEIIRSAQTRGRSRAAVTSKMECFVLIVNGFQPLTIITKHSILDVAAALDRLCEKLFNKKRNGRSVVLTRHCYHAEDTMLLLVILLVNKLL